MGLDDGSTNDLRLSAGYSWFLNDAIALEPSLYYSIISGDDDFSASEFGLAIGIRAFLNHDH